MRLATDPLLLRALLSRIEQPEHGVWGKPAVPPPLTSTPSPRMPVPIHAGYARRDAVLEPSLFPERFEASAEDWSEALVAGGMAELSGTGMIASLLASVVVALGLLGLFLILAA